MKNRKSKKGQLASMLLLSSMVIGSTIVPIHAVSYAESIDKDMETKIESSVKDNSNQTDVKVDLKENALKKAIKNVTKENAKEILDSLKSRKDGILDKETADQFEKWLEDLVSYVNVSAEAKTKDEDKIKELAKVFDKLLENKDKLTVEDVKFTMKDFKIPMVNKDKPEKEVVPEEDQDDCGCNKILDESLVNKDKESEKDKEKETEKDKEKETEKDKEKETEKEESKVKEFKAIENKDIDKDLLKKANDALKASIESYNKAMKDSKFEEKHHLELNEYERSIRYLGYWATNANEKTASKLEEAIKINQAWFNYFDLEVKKAAEETKGITDADKEKDKDKKPEKDQDKETEKKPETGDKVDQGTQTEEKDQEKDKDKDQEKDKDKDKDKDQEKDKEKEVIQPKVTIKDGKVIKSEITVEKTDDKKNEVKPSTSTTTTTPSNTNSTTTQSTSTTTPSNSTTTQSTSTPSTSTTTTQSTTNQSTTNQSTAATTPQNVEKDIKINVKENGVMMYLFDITDMKGSSTLTGKALEEEMLKKAKAKDWNQETPMQTLTSSNKNGEDGVIEFKGKAGHIYYLKASKNNKVEVEDIVIAVPGTAYDNESANGKAPTDNGKGTVDNGKGTAPESMPQTGDDNKTAKIAAGIAGVGLASAGAYVAIKKKSEVKEEVSK